VRGTRNPHRGQTPSFILRFVAKTYSTTFRGTPCSIYFNYSPRLLRNTGRVGSYLLVRTSFKLLYICPTLSWELSQIKNGTVTKRLDPNGAAGGWLRPTARRFRTPRPLARLTRNSEVSMHPAAARPRLYQSIEPLFLVHRCLHSGRFVRYGVTPDEMKAGLRK